MDKYSIYGFHTPHEIWRVCVCVCVVEIDAIDRCFVAALSFAQCNRIIDQSITVLQHTSLAHKRTIWTTIWSNSCTILDNKNLIVIIDRSKMATTGIVRISDTWMFDHKVNSQWNTFSTPVVGHPTTCRKLFYLIPLFTFFHRHKHDITTTPFRSLAIYKCVCIQWIYSTNIGDIFNWLLILNGVYG